MSLILLLGGARSGKSEMAEAMAGAEAARLGAGVTYVAGSAAPGDDADWAARIEVHRRRRPEGWETVEALGDLASALRRPDLAGRVVLLDSLGSWLAGVADFAWDGAVVESLSQRREPTLVVSEEVGLGVHPSSQSGRAFRDSLGRLNAAVSEVADTAYLVMAGRLLLLERP